MPISPPKAALGCGIAAILFLVASGYLLTSDGDPDQVGAVNMVMSQVDYLKRTTGPQLTTAEQVARVTADHGAELDAMSLTYENREIHLLVPRPRMAWQRLLHMKPPSFAVTIPDVDGAFGKRWNAGLWKEFGLRSPNGTFKPYVGRIGISFNRKAMPSPNPLSLLKFSCSAR